MGAHCWSSSDDAKAFWNPASHPHKLIPNPEYPLVGFLDEEAWEHGEGVSVDRGS